MGVTRFTGPVMVGTKLKGDTNGPNLGFTRLVQTQLITQNGAGTQDFVINIPASSILADFDIDILTSFDSATSAALTIGNAAGGTQFVSSTDLKASAGRVAITYTAAQLAQMAGLSTAGAAAPNGETINIRVVATGATTAGVVRVAAHYAPTDTLT